MKPLLTALVCLIAANSALAQGTVKLEKKGDTIAVTIGGKDFTTYNVSKDLPKPFFSPVRSADGTIITRGLENPEDHPHHKGIWCSIDEVNGIKFWAEKGKIQNVSADIVAAEGNPAKLRVVNHWLADNGKPVLIETSDISIFSNRLLAYDMKFTAGDSPVTFEDTKEGMFGIRVANTMREKQGGTIVNAEGAKGMKEAWGQESKWVDYYGTVEGKTFGVAIFDHPKNFRKSRFHVRDYGLFTLSPFGQKSYTNGKLPTDHYTVEPGKSFRLRYGIAIHDGDTAQGKVRDVYEQYLKAAGTD